MKYQVDKKTKKQTQNPDIMPKLDANVGPFAVYTFLPP